MKIPALPFTVTDWSQVAATKHSGETGEALWRTLNIGDLRVRMVEYSPGYLADHWCDRGHVLYVLEGELDSELRKFLYPQEKAAEEAGVSLAEYLEMEGQQKGGESMEPLSDYSKILELQEIKKLYEESQTKHVRELHEKDDEIGQLREELKSRNEEINTLKTQIQTLSQDREKLKQHLLFTKNDLESKIQRLQERIQQLSSVVAVNPKK